MSTYNLPIQQEHLVIITSTAPIIPPHWGKYLELNWSRVTWPNSRILVVCGVHGGRDGSVGPVDHGLVLDSESQLKYLKEIKLKEDIDERNISFDLVDVGESFGEKLDEEKFVKAVRDYQPTVLILGFCWTNVSAMNSLLRGAGIYAALVIKQESGDISEGRYLVMDSAQEQVVRKMGDKTHSNLFLWGTSGCGKTIVSTQVVEMMLAQREREGREVGRVIVSSYYTCDQLMSDLKEK